MGEDDDNLRSEGGKGEQAEQQPFSEGETTAVPYTRLVGNYQQATAAKREAHTSLLEIAIHVWRSGATCGRLLCHTDYGEHARILANHL